jgi:thiamine monophosphate synthase
MKTLRDELRARPMQRFLPITPGVGLDAEGLIIAAEALAGLGVHQLILREPWLGGQKLFEVALEMTRRLPRLILHTRSTGAVEVAQALGLAVHIRDGDEPPEGVAWGQSCHSVEGAKAAAAAGAAYVTLSPALPSDSKPNDTRPPLGFHALGRAQRQIPVPVFALGGVGPAEALTLRAFDVYGAAMIHAVFGGSPSPPEIQERTRMILFGLHYRPPERDHDPID